MVENRSIPKVSHFFPILTIARTIEYCLVVSAIAVAGLLIARGSDINAIASGGEPAKPSSNHVGKLSLPLSSSVGSCQPSAAARLDYVSGTKRNLKRDYGLALTA